MNSVLWQQVLATTRADKTQSVSLKNCCRERSESAHRQLQRRQNEDLPDVAWGVKSAMMSWTDNIATSCWLITTHRHIVSTMRDKQRHARREESILVLRSCCTQEIETIACRADGEQLEKFQDELTNTLDAVIEFLMITWKYAWLFVMQRIDQHHHSVACWLASMCWDETCSHRRQTCCASDVVLDGWIVWTLNSRWDDEQCCRHE